MSDPNRLKDGEDAKAALVWAMILSEQFQAKYKPRGLAAAVLQEVANALLQGADAFKAGRLTPEKLTAFANAVRAEGVTLALADALPPIVT